MHSWRVLLLPYLDQGALYNQYRFEEPWDGPSNSKLAGQFGTIFHCPDDNGGSPTDTSYVVVVGPKTMFPGAGPMRMGHMKDGSQNTILAVEIANSGIHWMEPRDLSFDDAVLGINRKEGPGISSMHEGASQIALGDGSVRYVADSVLNETIRRLLERNDGEPVGDY
jgi:hypothetical protein